MSVLWCEVHLAPPQPGDGTLTPRRDYSTGKRSPRAVALGDLNGDGKLDLVTANGATVVVRINTG